MALTKAEMSEYLFDKQTGEDIPITARRVVTFRPGQKLKSRVENASPKAE
ncbi:MAG: HU family DNA-binding protein [Enterobacter cloacae]|nr:HU family DNA-binding protein [Enterobacter cloacae]